MTPSDTSILGYPAPKVLLRSPDQLDVYEDPNMFVYEYFVLSSWFVHV